jgi:hypothetical protein
MCSRRTALSGALGQAPRRRADGLDLVGGRRGNLAPRAHDDDRFRAAGHRGPFPGRGRHSPRTVSVRGGGARGARPMRSLRLRWCGGPAPAREGGAEAGPGRVRSRRAGQARQEAVGPGTGELAPFAPGSGQPQSVRGCPMPDGGQYNRHGLLPGPSGRDHLPPGAATTGAAGPEPTVSLPLQGDPGGGRLAGSRNDLRVQLPRSRSRMQPSRPESGGREPSTAGPLLRLADLEGQSSSRVRFLGWNPRCFGTQFDSS